MQTANVFPVSGTVTSRLRCFRRLLHDAIKSFSCTPPGTPPVAADPFGQPNHPRGITVRLTKSVESLKRQQKSFLTEILSLAHITRAVEAYRLDKTDIPVVKRPIRRAIPA